MNRLPHHRSAALGRTFATRWNPADFDPIERPATRMPRGEHVAGVVLAVVMGIVGAALLAHWWST